MKYYQPRTRHLPLYIRPARPLWKGLVYEGLRLLCVVMTVAAVVGIIYLITN